jgi:hypothetical protein
VYVEEVEMGIERQKIEDKKCGEEREQQSKRERKKMKKDGREKGKKRHGTVEENRKEEG